jgi:ABC-2 type transport system ATP-binding protein
MKRRLALGCALIHEPIFLFVDEPTAGIDPILRQKIWDEFRRLRDDGRTLFVTTQYVGESEYCDEVAILDDGRIVALGAPDELRRQAFGGEMVAVTLDDVMDGRVLLDIPGVMDVRQTSPRDVLVVAENAGEVTRIIVEQLERSGHRISSIREHRPSFDDVFAELIGRHHRRDEP